MALTRLLTLAALLLAMVMPASGYQISCEDADTWQQKKRCTCVRCYWYSTIKDRCKPPDGVCRDSHDRNEFNLKDFDDDKLEDECLLKMSPSMYFYCNDEKLIGSHEDCCDMDLLKAVFFVMILVVDFFLFQWWFNKFDMVITCLCPSLYDFLVFLKDELMEMVSSGEEEEEEDE